MEALQKYSSLRTFVRDSFSPTTQELVDKALLFAALFGASQIIFESMRDDGHMLIIFLRIGQLGAAAMLIAASVILTKRAGKWCRKSYVQRLVLVC